MGTALSNSCAWWRTPTWHIELTKRQAMSREAVLFALNLKEFQGFRGIGRGEQSWPWISIMAGKDFGARDRKGKIKTWNNAPRMALRVNEV